MTDRNRMIEILRIIANGGYSENDNSARRKIIEEINIIRRNRPPGWESKVRELERKLRALDD